MFRYDYIPEAKLLAEGPAKFIIKSVRTKDRDGNPLKTKNGDDKIAIQFAFQDAKGNDGVVWQDISSKMSSTLKGLGRAIGINIYSQQGAFDEQMLIGHEGEAYLHTKITPGYDDKSAIKHFIDKIDKEGSTLEDDPIPF